MLLVSTPIGDSIGLVIAVCKEKYTKLFRGHEIVS